MTPKTKSHKEVSKAIQSGKLTRPARCEACGDSSKRVHAHHENYDAPLQVNWLCPSCHKRKHTHSLGRARGVKLQMFLTRDAMLRIRVASAVRRVPMGKVITDMALEYLSADPRSTGEARAPSE